MEFAWRRKGKRLLSLMLVLVLAWTAAGIMPAVPAANAASPEKVVLVGTLQSALGHSGDWDPAADTTEMDSLGNGYYSFTGRLPAGTYEYKIAVGGGWDESYGFSGYSNPGGEQSGENIKLTLGTDSDVTFYYNHMTHKIADSTYYTPIAAGKQPRVAGDVQTALGEEGNWRPDLSQTLLEDADFDNLYTLTKEVPEGTYSFKVVLGASWEDAAAYPAENKPLVLPDALPVTFKYDAATHEVMADFTVPVDPAADPVPAGHLRVHYSRADGHYGNQGLWLWDHVAAPSGSWPSGATPFPDGKQDAYGAYVDIPLAEDASKVSFLVVDRLSGVKDGGDKMVMLTSPQMNEVWIQSNSNSVSTYEPADIPVQTVRIHYTRDDNGYAPFGVWTWDGAAAPSDGSKWPADALPFREENTDRYGAYVDVPLKDGAKKISFLIVNRTTGVKEGGDKSFPLLDRYNRLWIKQGDDNVYVSPYGELATSLVSAEILSETKLLLGFTLTDGLDEAALAEEIGITDINGDAVAISKVTIKNAAAVEVEASINLENAPFAVTYSGRTVQADAGWRMLDEMYAYEGDDLGAVYDAAAGSATLKLWAPKATEVKVRLYDKNDSTRPVGSTELSKGERGVWSVTLAPGDEELAGVSDLLGYFYQYEVTNNGVTKKVLDPYAKSMAPFRVNTKGEAGPDGDTVGKAAIVDLSGTSPKGFGFAEIDGYSQREDAIIWEAHIRDFTADPAIEEDLDGDVRWGTYGAFSKKLDYIKSLGVTHIQLLPVMAWYFGDELAMDERSLAYSAKDNEYNWGYDPHGYFSPDGAYSSNPADPQLRIKELKGLIDAIHQKGMGVVLDVVYTHMAKASLLNDIVPGYYAFQKPDGTFIGGFGNNLATNRKMAEKLMIDSVKYWFEEYKIDGMRWDMMGDATYEAVQRAYDAAAAVNPNALFIGEGWRTFGGQLSDPALAGMGADQDWMDATDDVGVFSDEFRNELKSGYGSEGEPRFITGGARSIQTIFNNIKAQPGNTPADDPGDMVQYIEAHDNLPLYDVIAQSIKKDPELPANDLEIHKRIRLGNLLVLTSQGTAFLQAGQEYGRTKQWLAEGTPEQKYHELTDEDGNPFAHPYFIHDSYDSSDAVNMFDWAKATDAARYPVNYATKEYTAGLIELRRHTDAFRLGDKELVDSNVTLINAPQIKAEDLVIGYKSKATDGTGHYYVFVNADSEERTLTLNENLTGGDVLVDNDEAGVKPVKAKSGFVLTDTAITLEPLTAVVIRMKAAAPKLTSLQLDSGEYSLVAGSSHKTVVYAVYDDGSRRKVTAKAGYASDDEAAAEVSASGLVTAVAPGKAVITAAFGGMTASAEVTVTERRYVQLNYIRPDRDYTDWNLWVWNTGVKNDQIVFDKVENGIATVMLEIAPETTGVGFVLRKGTNWETAKQDYPDDRIIPVAPGAVFTKVNVTSMVRELDIVPDVSGPLLQDGSLTFIYRDDELFRAGQMGSLDGVKVKIGGVSREMLYDMRREWFAYTVSDLKEGAYEYTFLVDRNGTVTETTDPKNTKDGKSVVVYKKPEAVITSSVEPASISYNESAVVSVEASFSEDTALRQGYMDLTSLGGPAKVPFDTELMRQSVSVKDSVTAGAKSVPVTLVDEYGNKHTHNASVNVKARISAGILDFDWDEARIYFALTDRFADGDAANNEDVDKSHPEAYHGGDFKGLIGKLDYLQELGINTLWITPIVDNIDFNAGAGFTQYGYHGYWAKDFTKLDEHLGDMETFKELIEKAHDRGIKIMVDVVLNHTGYGLKPADNRPEVTEEDKARFDGMLRTDGVSADTNPVKGELAGLPDFRTEDAAVREQIVEWQAGWLERARTKRGDTIDYFRVDTVKHVESSTWVAFKNELTEIDPDFKLIGEYFGATADSDGGTLRSGQMDGLLDFGFKDRALAFANGSIDAVDAYLADREAKLDNAAAMGQFLSSHDENGFLSHYADGDEGKLKVAAALQITAKGQPVIYYGEELGRSGANAGDMSAGQFSENRGDMPWDRLEEERSLHGHYRKLLNIRAKYSKVYSKGVRTKIGGSDELGYLAFNKRYGGVNVVTVIHTEAAGKTVTVDVPFAAGTQVLDEYSGKSYTVTPERQVTFELPGRDDGGTVILAAAPSPDSSGAAQPQTADDAWVVSAASLQDGKDGKAVVELPAGETSVLLPIKAAELLAGSDLEVQAGGLSVTLPHELLGKLQNLALDGGAEGTGILLEARQLSAAQSGALLNGLQTELAAWRAASDMYSFRLSILTTGSGPVTVSAFEEPIVLTFKVQKDADRSLTGIYYVDEDGAPEYVRGQWSGDRISAEVYHFSSYAALEMDRAFADVPAGHWAYAAVKALAAKHIAIGRSGTRFAPEEGVTRAEFAAMLVRTLGATAGGSASLPEADMTASFTDVNEDAWYAPYVGSAAALGIVKGRSAAKFAPHEKVTREEMAVMIVRALAAKNGSAAVRDDGAVPASGGGAAFTDSGLISGWAQDAVSIGAEQGLLRGRTDGSFAPKAGMTRAESAQVIFNLMNKQ